MRRQTLRGLRIQMWGAGEVAQALRVMVALGENPGFGSQHPHCVF